MNECTGNDDQNATEHEDPNSLDGRRMPEKALGDPALLDEALLLDLARTVCRGKEQWLAEKAKQVIATCYDREMIMRALDGAIGDQLDTLLQCCGDKLWQPDIETWLCDQIEAGEESGDINKDTFKQVLAFLGPKVLSPDAINFLATRSLFTGYLSPQLKGSELCALGQDMLEMLWPYADVSYLGCHGDSLKDHVLIEVVARRDGDAAAKALFDKITEDRRFSLAAKELATLYLLVAARTAFDANRGRAPLHVAGLRNFDASCSKGNVPLAVQLFDTFVKMLLKHKHRPKEEILINNLTQNLLALIARDEFKPEGVFGPAAILYAHLECFKAEQRNVSRNLDGAIDLLMYELCDCDSSIGMKVPPAQLLDAGGKPIAALHSLCKLNLLSHMLKLETWCSSLDETYEYEAAIQALRAHSKPAYHQQSDQCLDRLAEIKIQFHRNVKINPILRSLISGGA